MSEERRCPSCGALISLDVQWCGQCFASLRAEPAVPRSEPRVGTRDVEPRRARVGEPTWPCPTCENPNPIALNECAVCGASFSQLLREPERRPEIAPSAALAWSLALPGLGHWKCGRPFDGVARAVLFAWTAVTVVVMLASRSGKGGLGPTMPLFALFLAASLLLYGVSALDAFRIATGEPELVTSRFLLWGSAGLMLIAAALAALVTLPAIRGG